MIRGAVVLGDLLRPDGQGRPGGTDRPTRWLWSAIKRALLLAAALPSEVLTAAEMPFPAPIADADAWWASVYARAPAAIEQAILDRLNGRFCIGYEMPPWLVHLLDTHGIPYLDLRLHPIRFLDDLLFAARASDPDTQTSLLSLAMHESEVIVTAGLREAMCRFISEANVPADTLLIAGQRRYDSTQIVNGRFYDAVPHAAAIHAICARYPAVILKPHPLDRHHSLLAVAAAAPTRVLGVIDDNIYRMMALPQISAVLTVNSGVAHEAPYFGKAIHTLAPLPVHPAWQGTAYDPRQHASLDDRILTPDFWRIVLAPNTAVTPPDGMRLPPKPNRLRIALDSFWNYQQIDSDRVPRG